ncbi:MULTISPECIES: YicC/YloC family endoribonuclease [unclassified Roseitalea]|uniref:YicC/YloC family endoribonuclease n=1 Tax=unclassified Roseitalea TaxID=2639107 RepID=UPI00273DBBA3|nr:MULTISPECIES: YicC/YloC family endoribonuclease [unclassified Roseitalea]
MSAARKQGTPVPSADIQSMTGFASASAAVGGGRFACDMRSVNGRTLDVKVRLPVGLERLEPVIRKRVGARLARGSVQVAVGLDRAADAAGVDIDADVFRHVASRATALSIETGLAPPTTDGILAVRGVIVSEDQTARLGPDDDTALLACVDEALDGLVAARLAEGRALADTVAGHLDTIAALVGRAAADPASTAEAAMTRLSAHVDRLIGDRSDAGLDPARLNAEVAILAAKADVREEIDRLTAHVAAARDMLAQGGPVGRRLDFLAQEFNREANTVCSKSASSGLTAIGLEMKSAIDQLREQVQNLQ